jgi:hypothetical protein
VVRSIAIIAARRLDDRQGRARITILTKNSHFTFHSSSVAIDYRQLCARFAPEAAFARPGWRQMRTPETSRSAAFSGVFKRGLSGVAAAHKATMVREPRLRAHRNQETKRKRIDDLSVEARLF